MTSMLVERWRDLPRGRPGHHMEWFVLFRDVRCYGERVAFWQRHQHVWRCARDRGKYYLNQIMMADEFQAKCFELRARIDRLRRQTDRHLHDSFGPPRLVESVRSMLDPGTGRWGPAVFVLSRLLRRERSRPRGDDYNMEELERLIRVISLWLRRLYRHFRADIERSRRAAATAVEDPSDE